MSTTSEHLEATVWLESAFPDIPPQQRREFFAAVDAYYEEHRVAERSTGALGSIRQDEQVFIETLRAVLGGESPATKSPSIDSP